MGRSWKGTYRSEEVAERFARKRRSVSSSLRRQAREGRVLGRILDSLPLASAAPVLDCGAGIGRLVPLLRDRGLAPTLCDISAPMLRHAACHGVPRVVCDAERLPFADGAFDVVVLMRVLHHVGQAGERRALLQELRRVTRRYLVLSFFSVWSLHEWRDRIAFRLRPFPKTRHALRLAELRADARAAGLRLRALRPMLPVLKRLWFAVLSPASLPGTAG